MIRIGIIGTGNMGGAHFRDFSELDGISVHGACDIDADRLSTFADEKGIPLRFQSVEDLAASDEIDAVVDASPDRFHHPNALAILASGKHLLSEKPIATSHEDALQMREAAVQSGRVNMVNFSYRNASALQHTRELIAAGEIGEVRHFSAHYLQSWLSSTVWGDWRTDPMWLWRLSEEHGSLGVLGDVGVHILDFASFPTGPFESIHCKLKTFHKAENDQIGDYPLTANDSAVITAQLQNGALGTIHTSRWATGHANSLDLSIHGTHGAIRINLDRSYTSLEICVGDAVNDVTWETRECPPTPSNAERFVAAIRGESAATPDFARGTYVQGVIDACVKSNESGTWESCPAL